MEDRSELAFFDLETTVPTRTGHGIAILEFGCILVCPRKLIELEIYETLVQPHDPSLIATLFDRANGITVNAVVSAPTFSEIADEVYDMLHGRIWVGHNINRFDCVILREAFAEINWPPPEPKGTIDTLELLTNTFGSRAGDMKMATLANYFELGKQSHRSLDDVRMNLEVLKSCATVLLLESSRPDAITESDKFLEPHEVSIPSINVVAFFRGPQKMQIRHRDTPLHIHCGALKVRFGLSTRFVDYAGRPQLSFVVDASPSLCDVLDACDSIAKRFVDFDSNSEWRPVVTRKPEYYNSPTIRFKLPTVAEGDIVRWITEIYQKETSSSSSAVASTQRVVFSRYDVAELEPLIRPGSFVDAYVSLDPYDYQQNVGIRLVAKKLIVDSN